MQDRQTIFNEVKKKAEDQYKQFDSVLCPALNKKINFNSKGLDHIKFKGWNKTRSISDQYLRFKFLKCAPDILRKAGTLQEFNETKSFERVKKNSRWEQILKPVTYYGFIAIVKYRLRVKVVVKEVEGGQPFFWSIIPFWKTKLDPITNETKKVFHDGDLEND